MIDSQENYKQIEDIIDVRKKLGQYNIYKQPTSINYRYAYSNSAAATSDKFIRFDDTTMLINEGDYLNNSSDIKRTDSEITVVRVRCDGLSFKRRASKWDMHDIAIPGDGSHLGESPSLVNLATLVEQNDEYLVPLSSWDPYYKSDDTCNVNETQNNNRANQYICASAETSDEVFAKNDSPVVNKVITNNTPDGESSKSLSTIQSSLLSDDSEDLDPTIFSVMEVRKLGPISRRPSLAGRLSKFLRRHCKKPKTLPEQVHQPDGGGNNDQKLSKN